MALIWIVSSTRLYGLAVTLCGILGRAIIVVSTPSRSRAVTQNSLPAIIILCATLFILEEAESGTFMGEQDTLRSKSDDQQLVNDPRVQHLSYVFEETGETIPYALFVPSAYSAETKAPLVVSLHGLTRTHDWLMGYDGLLDYADDLNFVVVTPLGYTRQGWYGSWLQGTDGRSLKVEGAYSQRDVMNVVALVQKDYAIDPKRIYLWGHSMGGAGTYHLAMEFPDMWAATAVVAPATPQVRKPSDLELIKHIPMLVLQGTKDRLVHSTRVWVQEMRRLNMNVEYDEMDGADHSLFISKNQKNVRRLLDFFNGKTR